MMLISLVKLVTIFGISDNQSIRYNILI